MNVGLGLCLSGFVYRPTLPLYGHSVLRVSRIRSCSSQARFWRMLWAPQNPHAPWEAGGEGDAPGGVVEGGAGPEATSQLLMRRCLPCLLSLNSYTGALKGRHTSPLGRPLLRGCHRGVAGGGASTTHIPLHNPKHDQGPADQPWQCTMAAADMQLSIPVESDRGCGLPICTFLVAAAWAWGRSSSACWRLSHVHRACPALRS